MSSFNIISPGDSSVYKICDYQTKEQALMAIENAKVAQKSWKKTTVTQRQELVTKFVDSLVADKEEISKELALLIGRPFKQNKNEVNGFETRARHLIKTSLNALRDIEIEDSPDFKKFMTREPLGVVLIIAAWNYPYLVSVNGVIPAILAGNAVILKQAPQTFPVADRFLKHFEKAGLPKHVFQVLQADLKEVAEVIKSPDVNYIHFTGSFRGGSQVRKLASDRFCGEGFELGGNDPAYVREDCDVLNAAENLVDGAMYNSGQSCCGIERIYVHEKVYDQFIDHAVKIAKSYVLGPPFDPNSTLGPVVSSQAATNIREHVKDAIEKGAISMIDENLFPLSKEGSCYVAPQILINVNHSMKIMKDETFGPVVGIMKVSSDEEAIKLMNDSEYGLTASVWTKDLTKGLAIGRQLETGTFFMNRCDYLDPALAWVGVKNSGIGCTLGQFGFDQLTRPKSYHLRK